MSIYSSDYEVGLDEEHPTGDVLAYRGSHIFPEPDDVRAAVFLASIPGHCVPGGPVDDFTRVGGFLRHDGLLKQPRLAVSAAKSFGGISSPKIRAVIVHELQRYKRENPDLSAWEHPQMKTVLKQRSAAARETKTELEWTFLEAVGDRYARRYGQRLPQALVNATGGATTSTATSTTTATSSIEDAVDDESSYPQTPGTRSKPRMNSRAAVA